MRQYAFASPAPQVVACDWGIEPHQRTLWWTWGESNPRPEAFNSLRITVIATEPLQHRYFILLYLRPKCSVIPIIGQLYSSGASIPSARCLDHLSFHQLFAIKSVPAGIFPMTLSPSSSYTSASLSVTTW